MHDALVQSSISQQGGVNPTTPITEKIETLFSALNHLRSVSDLDHPYRKEARGEGAEGKGGRGKKLFCIKL